MRLISIGTSQLNFKRIQFVGITSVAVSATSAAGTTSITPSYPAGLAAEDGLILVVGTKLQSCQVDTPAGWRRIKETIGFSGSNGSNQGAIRQTMFWKEATGSESGTLTVTIDTGQSSFGTMYAFRKDPRAQWNIDVYHGRYNTYNNVNYSVRSYESLTTRRGDILFCANAINTSSYTFSTEALAHTGATMTALSLELAERTTTTGNRQAHLSSLFEVTSGAGSGYLTYSALSSGAASTPQNPMGVCQMVRLRQSLTAQVWKPSGYRYYNPDDVTSPDSTNTGTEMWNGLRQDWEGLHNYSLITYNSKLWFQCHADLSKGAALLAGGAPNPGYTAQVNRRNEIHDIPWQPAYDIGTEMITEMKVRYVFDHHAVGGINICQDHTGSAGSSPNSPLWFLEIGYAGQFSGVPEGTLIISRGIPTRSYEKTMLAITSGTEYRIRIHVKYGYAGNAFLKIWVNGTQYLNDTTLATIATVAEDLGSGPGTGSVPNVGGVLKCGVYHHMVSTLANCQSNVNYGHNGLKAQFRSIKRVIKHPTDIDWGTGDAEAYAAVDTTND